MTGGVRIAWGIFVNWCGNGIAFAAILGGYLEGSIGLCVWIKIAGLVLDVWVNGDA